MKILVDRNSIIEIKAKGSLLDRIKSEWRRIEDNLYQALKELEE